MPKLVSNKIRNIMNKIVFSERVETWFWAQNTILLFKNKVREVSYEVNARTGNSSKNHWKWCQKPSQNRWKINTNFMVEKGMQKTLNIIQNWSQKGAKIQPKILQKSNRKNYENKLKKNPPMEPQPPRSFALPPPNPPLGNFRCKSNGPRRSVNSAQALPVPPTHSGNNVCNVWSHMCIYNIRSGPLGARGVLERWGWSSSVGFL